MEQPKFKWCRETIENVRFKPDRDKIWDELMAHIEDRTEAMKQRGYTEEEAECRAVSAMGDPAEVGRQLNAVHKPWLGWLWIASKVLVIAAMLFFIWGLFQWKYSSYGYKMELSDFSDAYILQNGENELAKMDQPTYLFYDEPVNSIAPLGEFEVQLNAVSVWRYGGGVEAVGGLLTVDGFLPWEDPAKLENLYVVDDLGRMYYPRYANNAWASMGVGGGKFIELWTECRTATQWVYAFEFEPQSQVQWFELRHNAEEDFVFRIDLTGGEAP